MDIKASDPIEITLSQSQSMDSVIGVNEEEVSVPVIHPRSAHLKGSVCCESQHETPLASRVARPLVSRRLQPVV